MLAQEMVDRSVSVRQVARQLGVDESTLRCRLKRPAGYAGRARRARDRDGHVCIEIAYRAIQHGYEARFVGADVLIVSRPMPPRKLA